MNPVEIATFMETVLLPSVELLPAPLVIPPRLVLVGTLRCDQGASPNTVQIRRGDSCDILKTRTKLSPGVASCLLAYAKSPWMTNGATRCA